VLTSELDHPDHVLHGLDQRDRERPLINREVPRPTSVVPLGVAWKHKAAREPAPKSMEIARPREVRGTSAAGHERHATSSTFSVLTAVDVSSGLDLVVKPLLNER
jgi:hypothetical protein